jgi:predicted Zn finger-like uncharacterized protein
MWCPNCKADVAAEVAADNRRVRCATCGAEISASTAFTGMAKTREARDLLERWASERRVDPPARSEGASHLPLRSDGASQLPLRSERISQRSAPIIDGPSGGGVSLEEQIIPASPVGRQEIGHATTVPPLEFGRQAAARGGYRVDPSQSLQGPSNAPRRAEPRQDSARLHRQHESSESPHFNIQGSILGTERRRTNWTSIVGQLIAYLGVALLTIGTTLIVWSYFGGPANYAPTGWLTTTAGQMLLFLGVVTLVSGGMEQTSEDVRTRIERLGERIIRIEQIAREQAMSGPYIPAEYYGPGGAPHGVEGTRQTVDSRN